MVRRSTAVGLDLVVRLGPARPREREAVPELDSLDRLDPHERRRDPRVESCRLLTVGAEARRDAGSDDLDDAAERVPRSASGIGGGDPCVLGGLASDLDHPTLDPHSELGEECLRNGPGSDVDRGRACARSLESVPGVLVAELQRAREVGVPGPGQRDGRRPLSGRLALRRPRAHPPRPVGVVAVRDHERERRTERATVPESGKHLHLVLLELLARAAPVALASPSQVLGDRVVLDAQPCREPRDNGDECGTVRLAGARELEGHAGNPTARRIAAIGAAFPVQHSKDAAPWATSTSSPVTTRAPAARAARAVAVSGYGRSTSVCPGRSSTRTTSRSDVAFTTRSASATSGGHSVRRANWRACRSASMNAVGGAPVADNYGPLRVEAREDRRVGADALDEALANDERVHGASLGRAERGDRVLVRRRHVDADETERRESPDCLGEPLGRRRERDVRPVEPERRERSVLHARREGALDRPADDPDERRGAGDLHHAEQYLRQKCDDPPKRVVAVKPEIRELSRMTRMTNVRHTVSNVCSWADCDGESVDDRSPLPTLSPTASPAAEGAGIEPDPAANRTQRSSNVSPTSGVHAPHRDRSLVPCDPKGALLDVSVAVSSRRSRTRATSRRTRIRSQ